MILRPILRAFIDRFAVFYTLSIFNSCLSPFFSLKGPPYKMNFKPKYKSVFNDLAAICTQIIGLSEKINEAI